MCIKFAVHNTYGIKAYNDTVYNYAKFANSMVSLLRESSRSTVVLHC